MKRKGNWEQEIIFMSQRQFSAFFNEKTEKKLSKKAVRFD